MAIEKLSSVDTLAAGDQLALYSAANGGDRKASLTALIAFLNSSLASPGAELTQYAAPNATGFNVQIVPATGGGNVYLLLLPLATYAAGTITLPALALCADRQELLVHCSQIVSTLTVAGNGATVNGAPTALAANGFFRLRFDAVMSSWYRVG